MKRLTGDDQVTDDTKVKHHYYEMIPELSGICNWSKKWLKAYKITGMSKDGAEIRGEIEFGAESGIEA